MYEINLILQRSGKRLKDFPGMPLPESCIYFKQIDHNNLLIQEELNFDATKQRQFLNENVSKLNADQKKIYDRIVHSINNEKTENIQKLFFIDGPGGTGKTFLFYNLSSNDTSAKEFSEFLLRIGEGKEKYYKDDDGSTDNILIPNDLIVNVSDLEFIKILYPDLNNA